MAVLNMQSEVISKLSEIFLSQGLTEETLEPTAKLLEELALDSFELVQLVMGINQCFAVEIKSQEIIPENFETLNTLANLVVQKLSEN